ncbi:MAG: hypothetical protein R3C12_05700 [Planctomycetaceae bacterium]|nr:hypothetical protein [Planctomycetaceae bacterium]
MEATQEQIEAIRRARRMFSEDPAQHDLSIGTCSALVILQLMELTNVVNRIAANLDAAGPGGSK